VKPVQHRKKFGMVAITLGRVQGDLVVVYSCDLTDIILLILIVSGLTSIKFWHPWWH